MGLAIPELSAGDSEDFEINVSINGFDFLRMTDRSK
jgi:hypothetical protein